MCGDLAPRGLLTLHSVMTWSLPATPRVVLSEPSRHRTFTGEALHRLAGARAAWLQQLGVGPGDRVACLSSNRAELVVLFLACLRRGAVLTPLNWRLSTRELGAILSHATPKALVLEGALSARGAELVSAAGLSLVPTLIEAELPALPPPTPVTVTDEAPALLLYTSGSTGAPKGVLISHRQLQANAEATLRGWELGPDDVAPLTTPLFHTGGWNVFATPLWSVGGKSVMLDGFDPDTFLDVLAAEGCTVGFSVPTQLAMLQQKPSWGRPLPLRFFISGGAPCPPAVMQRVWEAGYHFREGFGLTEFGPNCFRIGNDEARAHPGAVGYPMHNIELRLVKDDGQLAGVGEPGELWLKGPGSFSGYFNDAGHTAQTLDAEGFVHTGDLARRDADGRFHICGRKKDMYISGGENVFPGEVEAALADHPDVAEVAVVGIPDELWGEVGRAFVVARAGATLTEAALREFGRGHLGHYKVPKVFVVLPELPKLGSGKIDRKALRATAG